jgi:hypothetical protein
MISGHHRWLRQGELPRLLVAGGGQAGIALVQLLTVRVVRLTGALALGGERGVGPAQGGGALGELHLQPAGEGAGLVGELLSAAQPFLKDGQSAVGAQLGAFGGLGGGLGGGAGLDRGGPLGVGLGGRGAGLFGLGQRAGGVLLGELAGAAVGSGRGLGDVPVGVRS